jgi:hypothetical protein
VNALYHEFAETLKVPSLSLDETASGAQVGASLVANTLGTAKIVGRYGRFIQA